MKYDNVTISGQICTGKSTLRKLLSKKLGWQTFSTGELFRRHSKELNLSLEAADEQNDQLTKKIDRQLTVLVKTKTHFVVDSWMAGITAKNIPRVLKILLVCNDNIRHQRFALREKISVKEARVKVEERFSHWSTKIKKIYHRTDFFNRKYFDLVIDTSDIIPQGVLKKVLDKLGYKNSH